MTEYERMIQYLDQWIAKEELVVLKAEERLAVLRSTRWDLESVHDSMKLESTSVPNGVEAGRG